MAAPAHTRALMRELRRGLRTWADGLFVWAREEPDGTNAALAHEVAKAIIRVTNAMAAWSEDGVIVPGDARTARPSGAIPPHDFTP
jgi:hypothetical protein